MLASVAAGQTRLGPQAGSRARDVQVLPAPVLAFSRRDAGDNVIFLVFITEPARSAGRKFPHMCKFCNQPVIIYSDTGAYRSISVTAVPCALERSRIFASFNL